jgi:hypothetical protein
MSTERQVIVNCEFTLTQKTNNNKNILELDNTIYIIMFFTTIKNDKSRVNQISKIW